MTPTTWTSFFFFLYFLLPGLLLDHLSRRYQPSAKESALKELSRVILGSIVFTSLGFSILGFVRLCEPHWVMDLGAYMSHPQDYFLKHYGLIFRTLVIEEFIAFIGVWLFDNFRVALRNPNFTGTHQWDVLFRNRSVKAFRPRKWVLATTHLFNSESRNENIVIEGDKKIVMSTRPIALVTLISKEEIVGYVDMYSVEDTPSDREILISPIEGEYKPYLPAGFRAKAEQNPEWVRMYLPAHAIESIAVVYFKVPKD